MKNWFKNKMEKFKNDPEFIFEETLLKFNIPDESAEILKKYMVRYAKAWNDSHV